MMNQEVLIGMDDKLRTMIADEIMFAKEAAEYLGISVQRLNKLVHKGELIPVKMSPSGTLFMKRDLDERKYMTASIGKEFLTPRNATLLKVEGNTLHQAVNYFTIQSFYNYAQKKTEPHYVRIRESMDLGRPLYYDMDMATNLLGEGKEEILSRYEMTLRSFEKLLSTDRVIAYDDPEYPFELKRTEDGPQFLFLRGNIEYLERPIASIIGTKKPSQEEERLAYDIAKYLGNMGYVIASGLAKGIDTVVMNTALLAKYPAIAVLGTPINKVYPRENEGIQREVGNLGLVVSQYGPASPVKRWQFPIRAKVISGISQFTVVVDNQLNEGDYKQIEYGLKQGRVVFFPFPRASCNSKWVEKYLMRKGVILYKDFEDFKRQFEIIASRAQ